MYLLLIRFKSEILNSEFILALFIDIEFWSINRLISDLELKKPDFSNKFSANLQSSNSDFVNFLRSTP